jgi:hypothetical protein
MCAIKRSPVAWVIVACVLAGAGLAACSSSDPDTPIPTLASIDTLPTEMFLTANAPPAGFSQVTFDPIDANLSQRQGWHYSVTGQFEGTFDVSGEGASGSLTADVWSNELGQARWVILEVEGAALSPDDSLRRLEGVRWSNDFYFVDTNGQCVVGGEGAEVIGNLSAGQLVGGVTGAIPTGHRQEIEGLPAWQYTFSPSDARLPAIHRDAASGVALAADLWIAPEINAVLRYNLTITVTGVRLLSSEQAVSGTLYLNYLLDVPQLDVVPNISIPHGC